MGFQPGRSGGRLEAAHLPTGLVALFLGERGEIVVETLETERQHRRRFVLDTLVRQAGALQRLSHHVGARFRKGVEPDPAAATVTGQPLRQRLDRRPDRRSIVDEILGTDQTHG